MRKFVVAVLVALLALGTFGGAALAAAAPAPFQAPRTTLTDKQKAELTELRNQMLAVREKMIDKYVEYKWITPQQAEYMKDRIALQKKYAGQFGFRRGFGGRMWGFPGRGGRGGMRGGFGGGMMGGRGFCTMGGYGPWGFQAPATDL